jgi:hypothetical protein
MGTMKRWALAHWRLLSVGVLVTLVVLGACATAQGQAARLSGAVAFAKDTPETAAFLASPGVGYVEASLRFGPNLADDVIMFVDQEWLEGLAKPRWVKGGDWMALVGVQRAGGVWVGGGTDKALRGEASKDRKWVIHDLKQRLEPDTWYRLRIVADFAKRRFVSFSIQGGKLNRTIDISEVPLDYPNYMPFDRAGMIYIVGAMRSRAMMKKEGTPLVYFDDVEGGVIRADGSSQRLFFDDFESQKTVGAQPVTPTSISLSKYTLGKWYLERDESIFRIEAAPFARSGKHVGVADAKLSD